MSLLEGRRAVVTGAGNGIGREPALVCAREGARVLPGYTKTPMAAWVTQEDHGGLMRVIPMRRAGEPEEAAEVVALDRTPYTTGAAWAADGGMTAV